MNHQPGCCDESEPAPVAYHRGCRRSRAIARAATTA